MADVDPADRLRRAAGRWMAHGPATDLVDAATQALVDGMDTPMLRRPAGAPRRFAEEEAGDLAPALFVELGWVVPARLSDAGRLAGARARAADLLDGIVAAADLAAELRSLAARMSYPDGLLAFVAPEDEYDRLDTEWATSTVAELDKAVRLAAEDLVASRITHRPADVFPPAPQRRRWRR